MDDYRAPTPSTVASGVVLETDAAHELWRSGNAVWIDVLPAPRRPPNLPAPTLWMPLPRYDISGSLGCPMWVAVRSAPNSKPTFEFTSRWPLRVAATPRWCSIVSPTAGWAGTQQSGRPAGALRAYIGTGTVSTVLPVAEAEPVPDS